MIAQKTVPPSLYLAIKKNLTLPDVPVFADSVIPKLKQESELLGLDVTGPLEFIYEGCDGSPDVPFDLTIGFPIQAMKSASTAFVYITTHSFPCVFLEYKGSVYGIGAGWHEFFATVFKADLILTGQCREVYQHWVDHDSAENITELQIGISDTL
ncbi:MAG: GyrI-like domain-containing protein [Methylococcales bacterium]